jgi:hypothetical protein
VRAGYVTIDRQEGPDVDIVAEAGDLPFAEASVRELLLMHVLERFSQDELRRRLLPYWRSLLAPEGTFRAVVADGEAMMSAVRAQGSSFEEFRAALFDSENAAPCNLMTPESLSTFLKEAGFANVELVARARRNGKSFEFEIVSTRPQDS